MFQMSTSVIFYTSSYSESHLYLIEKKVYDNLCMRVPIEFKDEIRGRSSTVDAEDHRHRIFSLYLYLFWLDK